MMSIELSQRDKIGLAICALAEIDSRLAGHSGASPCQINVSGAMLESDNIATYGMIRK
jgi:hypothetical protein